MATRDEEHSTRGRANALRAVLSGKVPSADFTGKRLFQVMDLCLECKGCKAECPSNVDMAKMKYEFLHHYYKANGLPLRNRIFGHIGSLSWWGSKLAPLSNWLAASAPNRLLMETVLGIDRRRPLPAFARESLYRLVRPPAPACRGGAARLRGPLPRHLRDATTRPRSAGPRSSCSRRPATRSSSWTASAAAARSSPRACSTRRGSTRAGTSSACFRGSPRRGRRGARALVPAHASRRVGRAASNGRRTGGCPLELPAGGVPPARARPRSRPALQAGRAPRAAPRPLPPEGARRHGADGGRPRVGGLRGQRGGLRLLRHGGLLRLREGALRCLGDARATGAWRRPSRPRRPTPRWSPPASPAASRSSTCPAGARDIRPSSCGTHSTS